MSGQCLGMWQVLHQMILLSVWHVSRRRLLPKRQRADVEVPWRVRMFDLSLCWYTHAWPQSIPDCHLSDRQSKLDHALGGHNFGG